MSEALSMRSDPRSLTVVGGRDMMTDDDRLGMLRDWFRDAESASAEERAEAERARDYYDGKQLTAKELADLEARGQPPVIDNRIKPKVNYMLGLEKQKRTDPRAFGRNPVDEEGADAATDALRYVCDDNRFNETGGKTLDNILVEGFGGVEVVVEPPKDGKGNPRVIARHYRWERLWRDPHSTADDCLDAKYLGGVIWMDHDQVRANYNKARADRAIEGASVYGGADSGTYDDKPEGNLWADRKRKRTRVIQCHWREGNTWWLATYTAGGFLEPPAKSPYVDERGESVCALVVMSGYVDRKNRRYGIVRDMFDPQDEVNKRRSKALHLLNVRQVVADEGAVRDVDAAKAQFARPDGWVSKAPGSELRIEQTGDLATGQFRLLEEAKASLEGIGPNAFMAGRQGQAASGRAIALSQQGGAVEVDGAIMDRFHKWKLAVYRQMWLRIKQYWTEEQWVRVTDDAGKTKYAGLNRPMRVGDQLAQMDPQRRGAIMQQAGIATPEDPRLMAPVIGQDGRPVMMNNVATMNLDIVIDEAPDVATLQIEQFQALTELAAQMPGIIPPAAIIQASNLRNKRELLKMMEPPTGPDGQPIPPPPPPEVLRMQAELELKKEAQQAQLAADQQRLAMQQEKARQDAQIEQMKAAQEIEIERMKAENEFAIERERAAADVRLKQMEMEARLAMERERNQQQMELARQNAAVQASIARDAAHASG